jgi:phosphopantothenoylcysteine synthetase/decarboxylase
MPRCTLVLSGAPLAQRAVDLVAAIQQAGFDVDLVATENALASGWLDLDEVAVKTGALLRQAAQPSATAPRVPLPDAVVVCPATFNTLNKVALGIADTRAHSFLAECFGARLPMVFVPMINERLWNHPTLASHLELLRRGGAEILDIHAGSTDPAPVASGTGAAVIADFDPQSIAHALSRRV